MRNILSLLVVSLSISFAAHAKEAVAFVTHKVILDDKGQVSSIIPMKSEIVVPEGSKMSDLEHRNQMMKAVDLHMKKPETLFDFKKAFNTAKEKTVKVVTNPTFQKVAAGVVAAVGAGVAGVGAHSMMKDRRNKESLNKMQEGHHDPMKAIGKDFDYDKVDF